MSDDEAIAILTALERTEKDSGIVGALRAAINRFAAPTVDELVMLFREQLPRGFTITLSVDRNGGIVDVDQCNVLDYEIDFEGEGSISTQLLLALKACKDAAKEIGK